MAAVQCGRAVSNRGAANETRVVGRRRRRAATGRRVRPLIAERLPVSPPRRHARAGGVPHTAVPGALPRRAGRQDLNE